MLQLPLQITCAAVACAGVTGIGLDDSKVELYEAEDGDRGILAVEVCVCPEHMLQNPSSILGCVNMMLCPESGS